MIGTPLAWLVGMKNSFKPNLILLSSILAAGIGLPACGGSNRDADDADDQSSEEAKEDVDDAAEDVKDNAEDVGDKAEDAADEAEDEADKAD
jgi:hypothetical protein